MKIGPEEIEIWVSKIKEKGFRKFRLRELPEELRDKSMLLRAKNLGLINKLEKDQKCIVTWEINDNGKNNGKNNDEKLKDKYDDKYC